MVSVKLLLGGGDATTQPRARQLPAIGCLRRILPRVHQLTELGGRKDAGGANDARKRPRIPRPSTVFAWHGGPITAPKLMKPRIDVSVSVELLAQLRWQIAPACDALDRVHIELDVLPIT